MYGLCLLFILFVNGNKTKRILMNDVKYKYRVYTKNVQMRIGTYMFML